MGTGNDRSGGKVALDFANSKVRRAHKGRLDEVTTVKLAGPGAHLRPLPIS